MALVQLASFPDLLAAEIARGRLGSEGIEALLFDPGLSGLGLGTMVPVRLMVDEDDLGAARQVLSAGESGAG
jgi:hypothetical protein